ncbi:MAG: YceI family protein [Chitinophagales bacterium]
MKNSFIFNSLLTLFAFFAVSFTASTDSTTYTVDTEASEVTWKGYKVLGSHEGTIEVKNGSLDFEEGVLKGGRFEIDMTSMICTDLQGEIAGKLVGHLASDDFFGIEKYPTATFVITNVISRGKEGDYKVIGDLTIKESTNSIKLQAQVSADENGGMTVATETTIDRSDFNVKYGSGSFFDGLGDKTIYDEFDLNINLVVTKK